MAREGLPFVFVLGTVLLLTALWARNQDSAFRVVPPALLLALLAFVVYFFRDPERQPPSDALAVVSPADGRVIEVRTVDDEDFMEGPATRITIFLSIFDVHVQRAPVAGAVRGYDYRPGKYLVAWNEKASSENEQASLSIFTERGPVIVRQIAGLIARRIVTYPREGDNIGRGDRIGLIRFGSRVDFFIPAPWDVQASVGDRVKGGETVLAHIGGQQ